MVSHLVYLKAEGAARECRTAQFKLKLASAVSNQAFYELNRLVEVFTGFISRNNQYDRNNWMIPEIPEKSAQCDFPSKSGITQYCGHVCRCVSHAYLKFFHHRKFSGSDFSLKCLVKSMGYMVNTYTQTNDPQSKAGEAPLKFANYKFRRKVFLNIYIHLKDSILRINSQVFR